jgi:multidrug efflux pump subunit AcrA (membrane-fusion protein)
MPARLLRSLGASLVLALWAAGVAPRAALAQPQAATREIALRLDERQIRAAGIDLARVEAESGPAEITLPGVVVVPPTQLRIIAAPAAGLIEALFVAPDERVRPGQVVARLRSTELVEAQRLFLQAATTQELAAEKLRRDEQLHRERVIAERRLIVTRSEAIASAAGLDERTQMLGLLGMGDGEIAELRRTRAFSRPSTSPARPAAWCSPRRHPGERVAQAAPLLTVADLRTLLGHIQVPAVPCPALE